MRLIATATLLLASLSAWAQSPIEGRWITVDDAGEVKKSIVQISVNESGEMEGTIMELLREESKGKRCDKCPDRFKGEPLKGLTFMWGLTRAESGEWDGGKILDPKSGKIYKAKLSLDEGGETLTVRGFIGLSLFGRSQTWLRAE